MFWIYTGCLCPTRCISIRIKCLSSQVKHRCHRIGITLSSIEININNELTKIRNWLKLNKLSLNIEKTEFTVFHLPQRYINPPNIFIDNIKIEFVQNFNLLGICLNEHMSWKNHINTTARKISRSIGILNRLKHFPTPYKTYDLQCTNLVSYKLWFTIMGI